MKLFVNKPKYLDLISVLKIILGKSFKIFVFGIAIDYLRHLLFTLLRLKRIFIFIETKIKEKFS